MHAGAAMARSSQAVARAAVSVAAGPWPWPWHEPAFAALHRCWLWLLLLRPRVNICVTHACSVFFLPAADAVIFSLDVDSWGTCVYLSAVAWRGSQGSELQGSASISTRPDPPDCEVGSSVTCDANGEMDSGTEDRSGGVPLPYLSVTGAARIVVVVVPHLLFFAADPSRP